MSFYVVIGEHGGFLPVSTPDVQSGGYTTHHQFRPAPAPSVMRSDVYTPAGSEKVSYSRVGVRFTPELHAGAAAACGLPRYAEALRRRGDHRGGILRAGRGFQPRREIRERRILHLKLSRADPSALSDAAITCACTTLSASALCRPQCPRR